MMRPTCYQTPEDKATLFPAVVIPGIYADALAAVHDPILHAWLNSVGLDSTSRGLPQLLLLHALARAGTYKPAWPVNCDPRQPVSETILNGGDCDQWASVVLAALLLLGYPGRVITFGDDADKFRHVATAARFNGRWYFLDPKGDAAGLDFGLIDETYPHFEAWNAPHEFQ